MKSFWQLSEDLDDEVEVDEKLNNLFGLCNLLTSISHNEMLNVIVYAIKDADCQHPVFIDSAKLFLKWLANRKSVSQVMMTSAMTDCLQAATSGKTGESISAMYSAFRFVFSMGSSASLSAYQCLLKFGIALGNPKKYEQILRSKLRSHHPAYQRTTKSPISPQTQQVFQAVLAMFESSKIDWSHLRQGISTVLDSLEEDGFEERKIDLDVRNLGDEEYCRYLIPRLKRLITSK